MPTKRESRLRRGQILNPIRSRIMLPAMVITWLVTTKLFGLTEFESALWMLAIALMLTWGWVWDIADRLEQVEKEIADEAEQKRVEQLASIGRDPKGRFMTQDAASGRVQD